jgi:hypothetical protein
MNTPRTLSVVALLALALLRPAAGAASEQLDVDRHLRDPATRAVVVVLHASWSEESTARLAAWGRVHKAWHGKGLRTIVVNTQDPAGGCGAMGWTPDEVLCDIDGAVPAQLGASGVGVAFAWDWRGRSLGRDLTPDALRAAIQGALGRTPAVAVRVDKLGASDKAHAAALLAGASRALKASPRIDTLAGQAARSLGVGGAKPCKPGAALPDRGLLLLALSRDGRPTLTAALRAPQAGCTIAEGTAGLTPGKEQQAARAATDDLIRALQRPVKLR